jgi:heme exporter protein B
MVQATANILTGEYEPNLWIKLLLGYDIAFTPACLLLFDITLNAA